VCPHQFQNWDCFYRNSISFSYVIALSHMHFELWNYAQINTNEGIIVWLRWALEFSHRKETIPTLIFSRFISSPQNLYKLEALHTILIHHRSTSTNNSITVLYIYHCHLFTSITSTYNIIHDQTYCCWKKWEVCYLANRINFLFESLIRKELFSVHFCISLVDTHL
jgi:hypothetical protein